MNVKPNEVVVSVEDQGQGIPKEEQELLFKPFQRTSVVATEGEKSIGLGLFLVKNIVAAHGGRIWAESEQDRGSTFRFSIPIK